MWSAFVLLISLLKMGETSNLVSRHFKGDIFTGEGCTPDICHSSVTLLPSPLTDCSCQCDSLQPTFREDKLSCVESLHECEMAEFVSGTSSEKIPFVYLPLSGQLIYPSSSISIPVGDLSHGASSSPICVVSNVDILTSSGWKDMENFTSMFHQSFQLYREDDKTYLQWMGGGETQTILTGRLVLVHLLCKDAGGQGRSLFSPCIGFRVSGSTGDESIARTATILPISTASENTLTERDYLVIGVCAGFLLVLYIFAMVVFIFVKKKQRRDKQLRQQFLQLPLPTGIGIKSSKILGLEHAYLSEINRLTTEVRNSRRLKNNNSHSMHGHHCGHGKCNHKSNKDTNSISGFLKVDENLLDIHRKVVENELQQEVARTVANSSDSDPVIHGNIVLRSVNSQKQRFFPHLEEIPEESRNNTIKKSENKDEGDSINGVKTPESDISSIECKGINKEENTSQNTSNKSFESGLDSGINTRSTSPTPEQCSRETSDISTSSSQGLYTDYETVNVADTESDETDTDKEFDTRSGGYINCESSGSPFCQKNARKQVNNLDFLSEIYKTAFSKLPKVQNSDQDDFTDSDNVSEKKHKKSDRSKGDFSKSSSIYMYRNPIMSQEEETSYESSEFSRNELYIPTSKVSVIPISGRMESKQGDKLLICVNETDSSDSASSGSMENLSPFDQDTLERTLDKTQDNKSAIHANNSSTAAIRLPANPSTSKVSANSHPPPSGFSFHLYHSEDRESERRKKSVILSELEKGSVIFNGHSGIIKP